MAKVVALSQAREQMASVIKDSKRKFDAQNKKYNLLDFQAEARFALQAIGNSDQLLKCDPETVKDSMVHLAAMGLSLNPAAQQAALIPRWNSKKSQLDCTASPMYRGLVKLATDTGLITSITAELVFACEEETFDVDLGSKPYLKHRPKLFAPREERVADLKDLNRNRIIGAYCIAHLRDSEHPHITLIDLSEILTIANASDAFNPRPPKGNQQKRNPSGPWIEWPGEMIKKAVIRRATKQWPQSDDSRYQRLLEAVRIDNQAEANEQRTRLREDDINSDMDELLSAKQVDTIKDLCKQQNLDPARVFENYKVNSLAKIKLKYYGEIENKLLHRLQQYNAQQEQKLLADWDEAIKLNDEFDKAASEKKEEKPKTTRGRKK